MQIDLYLVDYFKEEINSGLATYVNELGKGIQELEHISLTYVWINSNVLETTIKEHKGKRCIYVPKIPPKENDQTTFDIFLAGLLIAEIADKTNPLIHLNWINHCSVAWHIKRKIDCKIILTKHCIPWRDWVTLNYGEFYYLNTAINCKETAVLHSRQLQEECINYENLDHIITVTNFAKENLMLLFNVRENDISVINNGLGLNIEDFETNNKDALRKQYGFRPQEKIIFFAGTITKRKGIIDLVEIFELFVEEKGIDVRLVISGPGDPNLVLRAAKKYSSKITLTGNLEKSVLYDFYQMADIGILLSYIEQCSYTAIEMMQFGLPIIVSDVDGLKEIVPTDYGQKIRIDFEKNGLRFDKKDLIAKLELLLSDETFAREMAMNLKAYAIKRFSSKRMVESTTAVYHKILCENREIKVVSETSVKVNKVTPEPLVSVLMPCYNGADYLQDSIDSVLEQKYRNFELVIVDDGSTDNSVDIVNNYTDPRIKLFTNSANKGIVSALNTGLEIAKGKYIARIDSDDIMSEERLSLQIDFLETNPDYGMVGSCHEVIDSSGRPVGRIKAILDDHIIKLGLLFKNQFAHSAVTMRTDLCKKFRYNSQFKYCEDYDLWLRISSISKIKNLPNSLLSYRVHSNNISAQGQSLLKQNVITLLSRQLKCSGIEHSYLDLSLHSAICFGLGKVYFNTVERVSKLDSWLDKVLYSEQLLKQYDFSDLSDFKRLVMQSYCGVTTET